MKILVTTYPFGESNDLPIKILKGHNILLNDKKRKYTQSELIKKIKKTDPEIIIAGTENYDSQVFKYCNKLKLISRVGIGLDSIDQNECKKRKIIVTYTPDGPSNSVSEMVIGQMINSLRELPKMDANMRLHKWYRYIGKEIKDCKIGIIGCGRIGKLVAEKLQSFKPQDIFVNDIVKGKAKSIKIGKVTSKKNILIKSDIITIHIPLNKENINYISKEEFKLLKKDAVIINTSRGGIINEKELYRWLKKNKDAKAVIDVFEIEPYFGRLIYLKNTLLTPHLGSCSESSRLKMEFGAAEEVLNYLRNKPFNNRVV